MSQAYAGIQSDRREGWRVPWWTWIVGIDLILLFTTAIEHSRLDWPYVWRLVIATPLTQEMNVGAWWSSLCLFAAALMAYELSAKSERRLEWAWLGLALFLAFLSLDEIGALHERTTILDSLGVFALGAGLLAVIPLYAVFTLLRREETRTSGMLVFVAFALLASIAVQEKVEHLVAWNELGAWAPPLRSVVEEGTELAGVFLLLAALVRQRTDLVTGVDAVVARLRPTGATMSVLAAGFAVNIVILLAVAPRFEQLGMSRELMIGRTSPSTHINPGIWYPAMLNALMFTIAFWRGHKAVGKAKIAWKVVAGLCLVSSVTVIRDVSVLLPRVSPSFDPELWTRLMPLYVWQIGLVAWLLLSDRLSTRTGAPLAVAAMALASMHLLSGGATEATVLLGYSAFVCVIGTCLVMSSDAKDKGPRVRHEVVSGAAPRDHRPALATLSKAVGSG